MKLVWHIFKKDLRRMAWPLALWGAVIAMQYFAWRFARAQAGHDGRPGVEKFVMLLWGLHLVVAWLIVPRLIHDDPLIGDRADWRVRPISGARLLAAKIFGAAAMLWLWPSLLTVPWWIEFGFGVGEIARAVAVNMVGMAFFTGVAMLVAVLTDGLARFLAWSVVLAVAAGLGGLVLVAGMPANGEGPVSAAVLITRASLVCGLVVATVAVVVPLQFLRRRTALARVLVAVAALAVGLIVQGWPWSTAQMLAQTGWKKIALPTVSARIAESTLVVPADPARQMARVSVTTEFAMKGLAGGDLATWRMAETKWRIGESRGPSEIVGVNWVSSFAAEAGALARGDTGVGDTTNRATWEMKLPGLLVPRLRNGEGVLSARNGGAIWRGELGPQVAARAGAGAARGLRNLHVSSVRTEINYHDRNAGPGVQLIQTEPLFTPSVLLEIMNLDGMGRHRRLSVLLRNDREELVDERPQGVQQGRGYLPRWRIPVGLMGVIQFMPLFGERWWQGAHMHNWELPGEGATVTSVVFQEAAPMNFPLAETAFVPDLIIEGRLDEALRRAKAEGKLVLARVARGGADEVTGIPEAWKWSRVREVLVAQFVGVQVSKEEAMRLRKTTDDESVGMLVVLKAGGAEQDRLRDLGGVELQTALRANAEGKSYAGVLTEMLAAKGGEERALRLQLHDALRARGELAGAFDAIIWLADHPQVPFEGAEIFAMGWRLEKFVASYGPGKAALLERRDRAITNLRQDPRDEGSARRLFAITLGLRHVESMWSEFTRLLPRENPLWWEFTRNWISLTLQEDRAREAVGAVDLEKFFADGPAWVRAQLAQKRTLSPGGQPASIDDWQRQLVQIGTSCVGALAEAGRRDAALRLAKEVRRIDGTWGTRSMLADVLRRAGANAEAENL